MASGVFWGGGRADEVADFDEYDPTPYGGGYDLALTFGRALPPSEETCYPVSTNTSSSSCDRPQYGQRPDAGEGYGAAEPHRGRPQHEDSAGYGSGGYERRPHAQEESHGSSAAFGYGRKAHDEDRDHGEAYGSAAGGYRKPKPAYGDERPKYQSGDGDGDDRPSYGGKKHDDDDDDRPSYGRRKNDDDDDSDGERKPRYKKHDDDDDSDDEKKQRYGKNNRRRHDYDD